ncbi:MAG: Hemolysin, chromosomal [Planctomycetota bacterium]|jgi:hypothetical protein
MRKFLNNLFNPKKPDKKNASTKLELLSLEARITPSVDQPMVLGEGILNDFTAIGADAGGGPLVTVTFPAAAANVTATVTNPTQNNQGIVNGQIFNLALSNPGTGYLVAPRITISGGQLSPPLGAPPYVPATAKTLIDINSGSVTSIIITNPGSLGSYDPLGTAVVIIEPPPAFVVPTYTTFFAYDPRFTGGVRVAIGDVNKDGIPEIITAAGPGGSPHIKVFTVDFNSQTVNPNPIVEFFAFDQPNFKGGVNIAVGDTNGDGFGDIICGAGATGGPRVTVYAGTASGVNTTSPLNNFFAYAPKFNGGVVVTAGQRNSNAGEEVIVAPASNGGYNIKSFDVNGLGSSPKLVDNFFAFNDSTSRGGLSLAAGDLDQGLGITDLVVGTTNNQFGVILNNQSAGIPVTNTFGGFNGTIRAGVARNVNGREVAVALAGPGGAPRASIFSFETQGLAQTETAFVIPTLVNGAGSFARFFNTSVGYFPGGLFGSTTLYTSP